MTLQALLFFNVIKGRDLGDISDTDLILSISSAIFNSFIQLFRLRKESTAAQETFVQYSLNCITARYVNASLLCPFCFFLSQSPSN